MSGRIDDEYGEMLDEHNLNIDNGRVDGFNIMCSNKPKAEEDETQQDVIGGGSGESVGSGEEELEADWYTIIDPSARRTQGTLCWPANRADLEKAVSLVGGSFKLICVWARIDINGPAMGYNNDIEADGLVVVIDETDKHPWLETTKIAGPFLSRAEEREQWEELKEMHTASSKHDEDRAEDGEPSDGKTNETKPIDSKPDYDKPPSPRIASVE